MSFDSTILLMAVLILVVGFTGKLLVNQTAQSQQNKVLHFWQQTGLPVGHETINAALRRRLHRSSNAVQFGGLIGVLVALILNVFLQLPWLSFYFAWGIAAPAIILGSIICDVALTLRDSLFGTRPDRTRAARLEAVTLADYMSPLRRLSAPVIMVLATVTAGVSLFSNAGAVLRSPAIPLYIAAAIVLSFCVLIGRKVLELPQPAADSLELAWDDAIRADVIRKLGLLASTIAWLAVASFALGIAGGPDLIQPTSSMEDVYVQTGCLLGYSLILGWFSTRGAYNWFRKRLWLDDDVFLPHSSPENTARP